MLLQTFGIGDSSQVQAQWDQWYGMIQNLNRSLALARSQNNPAMEAQVRAGITWVMQQMVSLSQQIKTQEMPSDLMVKMDQTSDAAIKLVTDVGSVPLQLIKDVGAVGTGLARTVSWLPFLLIGALAVLGLGFGKGGLKIKAII